MAEIQLQRIRGVYGEIAGILGELPLEEVSYYIPSQIGRHYNTVVDELNQVAETNYSRSKLVQDDYFNEDPEHYITSMVRIKVGGLVKRLEQEYSFGTNAASSHTAPVVVTVNQNQQVTVSVTPIQQIIDSTDSEDVRQELEELKRAVETGTDQKKTSSILNSLQQKSWEVFMKVLPYMLEHWDKHPK